MPNARPGRAALEHARRNIVTHGISLNGLVGQRFRIGSVECIGRRLAEPSPTSRNSPDPDSSAPLVHRGGPRADITKSGVIRLGDEVKQSTDAPPDEAT